MILESARLSEPLTAVVALEGSFAGMYSHVNVQPRRRSKPLPTDDAVMQLLTEVHDTPVSVEVAQPRELRAAVRARERSVAGMPQHVVLERAQMREPLLADVTAV